MSPISLDEQRRAFTSRRFLAMPLAGATAWLVVAAAGLLLPPRPAVWVLYGATGSIVYLGMLFSRITGEDFFRRGQPKNSFDTLFFYTVAMSLLVYAVAIPFFLADYTSLPLTVGILTGLMWLPLSWIIQHWVGVFHAVGRTGLLLAAWYLLPTQRFVVLPLLIVLLYGITIVVLERRWHGLPKAASPK
ncbi:DUF7010 family protein [Hymenobacter psychrophilus]|uniref:DUF308 domain-containing protein n=1 Tax=Hymenobacter psychrophilus TaxID=651662 RepID=A0A1H3IY93_9BACT|nr:hypothetical protein [Hymenobacter psychrophilus]SDY32295.1 hypothetical protein SAMN04488069_107191 [Hymenobacter psychrophilus]